jgi:hypothetical protein
VPCQSIFLTVIRASPGLQIAPCYEVEMNTIDLPEVSKCALSDFYLKEIVFNFNIENLKLFEII